MQLKFGSYSIRLGAILIFAVNAALSQTPIQIDVQEDMRGSGSFVIDCDSGYQDYAWQFTCPALGDGRVELPDEERRSGQVGFWTTCQERCLIKYYVQTGDTKFSARMYQWNNIFTKVSFDGATWEDIVGVGWVDKSWDLSNSGIKEITLGLEHTSPWHFALLDRMAVNEDLPPLPPREVDDTTTLEPEEPTTLEPEDTTTSEPEEPTTSAPEDPTTFAPEDPSTSAPEDPTTSAPEDPSTSAPEDPTTSAPEDPTTLEPEEPTTLEPEEPTTLEPEEPTTLAPEDPTTLEPEEPTTLEPEETTPFLIDTTPEDPTTDGPETTTERNPSTIYIDVEDDIPNNGSWVVDCPAGYKEQVSEFDCINSGTVDIPREDLSGQIGFWTTCAIRCGIRYNVQPGDTRFSARVYQMNLMTEISFDGETWEFYPGEGWVDIEKDLRGVDTISMRFDHLDPVFFVTLDKIAVNGDLPPMQTAKSISRSRTMEAFSKQPANKKMAHFKKLLHSYKLI